MKKHGAFWIAGFVLFLLVATGTFGQTDSTRAKIERIVASVRGKVGVAVVGLESRDTLAVNGSGRFPMQSVYKLPLALAVLDRVDKGDFSLDQKIHIEKKDLLPNTWSPLREKHPQGGIDLSMAELLTYTVAQSDNNCCDILFRLAGGPKVVERFLRDHGIKDIAVVANEEEMHRHPDLQYRNWSSPVAMGQLLSMFYHGEILKGSSKDFLWQTMVKTSTGPRRLKGLLPAGTIVAHKTGSSGADQSGMIAATNDVGIIALPGGKHVAVVVFVADASGEEAACEDAIAGIAKAVWDAYAVH